MAKRKKPIDYISSLCKHAHKETRLIGHSLLDQYREWTSTLKLDDLLAFMQTIQENKHRIGVAQLFGKFRACSFEEYIYRLIQAKIQIPKVFSLFWEEKCLIRNQNYGIEMDITIGKRINRFVDPILVVDAKVELDASRLKTALASFTLLKHYNPKTICYLAYIKKEIASSLLALAKPWMEKTYEFSKNMNETDTFINSIQAILTRF